MLEPANHAWEDGMIRRVEDVVKALAILAFASALHCVLVFSNFYALASAFELQGYENTPIKENNLLGPLAIALGFGNTSFAEIYALIIALTIGVGFILLFRHLNRFIALWFDRHTYLQRGDATNASAAVKAAGREAIDLALIAIPLVWAAYWDIQLFVFRQVVNQVATPMDDITAIPAWSTLVRDHGGMLFMAPLMASVGGYLACTALACQMLEKALATYQDARRDLAEEWERTAAAQTPPPNAPDQSQAVGPATEEVGSLTAQTQETSETSAVPITEATLPSAAMDDADHVPVSVAPPPAIVAPEIPRSTGEPRDLLEVIGATPTLRLSREQARLHPDLYHVDSSGRIWLKTFLGTAEDITSATAA